MVVVQSQQRVPKQQQAQGSIQRVPKQQQEIHTEIIHDKDYSKTVHKIKFGKISQNPLEQLQEICRYYFPDMELTGKENIFSINNKKYNILVRSSPRSSYVHRRPIVKMTYKKMYYIVKTDGPQEPESCIIRITTGTGYEISVERCPTPAPYVKSAAKRQLGRPITDDRKQSRLHQQRRSDRRTTDDREQSHPSSKEPSTPFMTFISSLFGRSI
jgi:hypothetical protein